MTNYQPLKNLHSRLLLVSLMFLLYISYDLYKSVHNQQTILAIVLTVVAIHVGSQLVYAAKQIVEIDKLEKHERSYNNIVNS